MSRQYQNTGEGTGRGYLSAARTLLYAGLLAVTSALSTGCQMDHEGAIRDLNSQFESISRQKNEAARTVPTSQPRAEKSPMEMFVESFMPFQ